MNSCIILFALLLCFATETRAQVFVGLGFSDVQLSERALDDAAGFSIMIEKDVNLSKSRRWKLHPGVHISFLFSDAKRDFEPLYLNFISVSPKVSHFIISGNRVKIAPYVGPFFSLLLGLQSGDPAFESTSIQQSKIGIESGVQVDVSLGKTSLRIIPLGAQIGQSLYRQRIISLMVSM